MILLILTFFLYTQSGLQSERAAPLEGRAWKQKSDRDRGREQERGKMDAVGGFVRKKMGRRWDPTPYLSRQLHLAHFYLGWQRGMWGSLHLAFNWLSICQHFSQFPPLKALPSLRWSPGILTSTSTECELDFKLSASSPTRLGSAPSSGLWGSKSEYLKICRTTQQ